MGDWPSVPEKPEVCSMQNCKDVPCFGDAGAVAGADWAAPAKNAVSVTKGTGEKSVARNGLEEGGDNELAEFHFGFARGVSGGFWGAFAVWGSTSELEEG